MSATLKLTASVAAIAVATSLTPAAFAQGQGEGFTEDIIVTGTKRDTQLIDTPIAVQVFTELQIEKAGIQRPADYLNLTPNVTFLQSNHAGEAFVNIRGQASVRQSESAVAVVIDGVQLATQNEFNGDLFDVEQIEILKGPQGALYGRNAAAGAIIVRTKAPSDEFEGKVLASYGNWDSMRLQAGVGGPIIEGKLRFRAAASLRDTEGPFENINTGENVFRSNEKNGRVRLEWLVNEKVTADLRFGASSLRGGGIAFNAQVAGSTVGNVFVPGVDTSQTNIPFVADVPGANTQDKWNSSLKVDWEEDWGTFTSVTAFSSISDKYQAKNLPYGAFADPRTSFVTEALSPGTGLDVAAIFGDNTQKFRIANRAFTQEFRLTSPDDQRLRWQVGMFFLTSDRNFTTEQGINGRLPRDEMGNLLPPYISQITMDATPLPPLTRNLIGGGSILPTLGIDGPDTSNGTINYDRNDYGATNYAPFGNVEFDVTEDLTILAAIRYDIEKRDVRTETPDIANPFFGVAPGAPAATYNLCVANTGRPAAECFEEETFKQISPKLTVTYRLPDNSGNIYATWGRSFKSGGFNPIGTRAVLLAAPGANPSNIFVQDAYDKEVADQYEIGFKTQLFDNRVRFNGAAFYTDIENAQQFEFFPVGGIQAVSSIDNVEIFGVEADVDVSVTDWMRVFAGVGYVDSEIKELRAAPQFEGNVTPYSQEYNIIAGFQIDKPITDSLDFNARLEYNKWGPVWFDSSNLAGTRREPVDLVNARIGVSNDRWQIALWARNLNDEEYNIESIPLLSALAATYRAVPRSYGVEASVKF
ncbi:MAG: TonB-dependent receptor [Pseudomonadota bacterium]